MTKQIIHIQWEGPFTLEQVYKLIDDERDYGIYQIYGRHPSYGGNALLYIGQANQRTFGVRIKEHEWDPLEDGEGAVQVHVGRLAGEYTPSDEQWSTEIDKSEKLLINVHKPAYNASSVGVFTEKVDRRFYNVHVLNWGEYGALLPEASGERWTEKWTTDEYGIYGSHRK